MRVIIAGGGTAGHIVPALVVGKALQKKGCNVVFVGNKNSMEQRLNKDFPFVTINVQKIYRKLTYKHLLFPIKLGYSFLKSVVFFVKFKPDVFFGSGGFVCGAPALAAFFYQKIMRKKINIYFHEQNSFPGLVTKSLGKFATKVFLGNKQAASYFAASVFVGNPIQDSNVKKGVNILLVGGSQGSQFLNEKFSEILPTLLKAGKKIDWQVGEKNLASYKKFSSEEVNVFGFSAEMPRIYNRAGLVICRSGALTLAELQARGLPAVLVPLDISAGNHQYHNAVAYATSGAGTVLEEKDCNPESLKKSIFHILDNYKKFAQKTNRNQNNLDPGKTICQEIIYDFNNGE